MALLPVLAIADEPFGRLSEGIRLEMAETRGRLPAARDQARRLEHAKVLRDGGLGDLERCRQLEDRGIPFREARQDGAAGGVGKGAEDGVELVVRHRSITIWLCTAPVNPRRRRFRERAQTEGRILTIGMTRPVWAG